jgi:Mn2+/Fe2+ NRAMP family transporter
VIPGVGLQSGLHRDDRVGLTGTAVTPWMQFALQASIVEKGITVKHFSLSRWDVIIGCIVTDVICVFIVVACAAT